MFIRVCFLLFFVLQANEIHGVCNLTLKDSFGSPSPIYLHDGKFLAPNSSGGITLQRSETLMIACPGTKRHIVINNNNLPTQILNISCVQDTVFQSSDKSWKGYLSEINCDAPPWFSAKETNITCYGGHKIYRVGYEILNKFFSLYEACFDKYLLTTIFVKHSLTPASKYSQVGSRPSFIEGNLFNKVQMSKVYKIENQRARFDAILGNQMSEKYLTKKQYLNRGHLSPRADYSLSAEQRGTFHYVNTAPQWMRGNAGDWAALEEALRRRVNKYGSSVDVYTGTFGVSTLPDSNDRQQQLFLAVDDNNNGIVPVPMYNYKVVHDPAKKTAVVFISINSSYYNHTYIDELSFCDDICDGNPQYSWLKWRSNDGTHSFCCTYEDFHKKIKHLPRMEVHGTFY